MSPMVLEMDKKRRIIHHLVDWLVHMIGYALVLITMSVLFRNALIIDNTWFGFWGLLAAIFIFVLNKTIKPLLVWLTLPITALTLGLFYPFINVFILALVSFLLGSHFVLNGGIFMTLMMAILISIMNSLMDHLVINRILGREE